MPQLIYTQQNMPATGKELREQLNQAWATASPLDDFTTVIKALTEYEIAYQLSSAEFYERFQRGEMGDAMDYIRWANRYEMYLEMRQQLESLFDLLASYALPAAA